MNVFAHYSRYYDLLYRDKDYAGETAFVAALIQEHVPNAKSVLELGCGTGIHAKMMVERGFEVHGLDNSTEMMKKALSRKHGLTPDKAERLSFSLGDVRTSRFERKFDAVISLFHVMSYQITNEDLLAAMETARVHLSPGGVFIFDCWYGPAVLTDRPELRVKRLEDDLISVTRIAEPVMHPNENVVDVNYQVLVRDKVSNEVQELREMHRMRYLFRPELEQYLYMKGMNVAKFIEWMTGKEPGFDTWGVCFVARNM